MDCKFVLRLLIVLALSLHGIGGAGEAAQKRVEKKDIQGKKERIVNLGLQKLVNEVVRRNANAVADYLQAQMSRERIEAEKGIFEPLFQTSLNGQRNHIPNSTEDILTRQQDEYLEKAAQLDLGLKGMISSGANWELKFVDRQRNSSTIERFRDYEYEYDNAIKLSLEQPLLKGFGKDVTHAKIDIARVQSEIDDRKYEQKLMELVALAIQLYWKLYGAEQIHQSWKQSIKIAEESLRDMELRAVNGKIPQTDLMEAESAISTRRGELLNARNKVIEAQNQLMTLLNVSVFDNERMSLIATDDPFIYYDLRLHAREYAKMALEKWPEYEIAKKEVEKEKIQVNYAQNQLLPQLDLSGSVGLNSLAQEYEKALRDVADTDFFSWSAGIKFSMPIFDNVQAKSNLSIAKMRVKQADVALEAMEKNLSNAVHSKIEALVSLQEQLKQYERGLKIRGQLLEIERERLRYGRVSMKDLLRQQEEYVDNQRKVFSSVVNYKLSEATLEIAIGSILDKYQIDPKSISHFDGPAHQGMIFVDE